MPAEQGCGTGYSINRGSEPAFGKLVLFFSAGHDAKPVGFHDMGSIGNVDDKALAPLDVLNGFPTL